MSKQIMQEALNGIHDKFITEAAEVLGLLEAPAPVAAKPRRERENSLLYRFMNSGWGVACISLLVAFTVLGGIIWAGQRPFVGGPVGTQPETEAVDYSGDSQDELTVKHGDTVIYPRRFFLWSSDGKVSADGLGFKDTVKQDYDGVPVLPKVYYAMDGSISPCELRLAKGYECSSVRIYDTDMRERTVIYGSFNYKELLSSLPVGRCYVSLAIVQKTGKRSGCYEYAFELEVLDTTASGIISEEQAMQIASEYWGIKTGDVADNGFTFRIESQGTTQTPKGESVYRIALRWLVNLGNDSHYSTVDTVWVDMLTGEVIIPYAPPAETETERASESETAADSESASETEPEKPHDVHTWGDWTFVQTPTCTEDGSRTRSCTHETCTEAQYESLPSGRHVYNGEGGCTACTHTLTRNDTFLTFTSNGDGTCSVGCSADGEYLDPVLVLPNYSPDGDLVTAIEEAAFRGRFSSIHATTYYAGRYLTSVTLPAALETIGDYGFDWCEQLTEVIFPNSLRSIGEYAFHLTGITSLALPEGVTTIDTYAFGDCLQLEGAYIPASVTEIGVYAFGCCESLVSLVFGEGSRLTAIPAKFAEQCTSLTEISLPASVTFIGDYAFTRSGLTSIVVPQGVTEIGIQAFANCKNLASVQCPDTLMQVGRRAFHGSDALPYTRFDDCLYLAIGNNPYAILTWVEDTSKTTLEIHADTRLIDEAAFCDCLKLTELTYGGTVEEWSAVRCVFQQWPDCKVETVVCSDGRVMVNEAHS